MTADSPAHREQGARGRRQMIAVLGLVVSGLTGYSLWVWHHWYEGGHAAAEAAAVIVQVPILVGSVVIASWQVLVAARASRSQSAEQKVMVQRANRPYVVAQPDYLSQWTAVYLELVNMGRTAARNVVTEITPPLRTAFTERSVLGHEQAAPPFLRRPVPVLAPGQKLTSMIEVGPERARREEAGSTFDDAYMIKITYTDDDDMKYEDEFPLDLELLWTTVAPDRAKPQKDLLQALREIKNAIGP